MRFQSYNRLLYELLFRLIVGKNESILQVPFLNLMSNIQQRAGQVNVRIGGSSVDVSSLVGNLGSQTEAILYGAAYPVSLFFPPYLKKSTFHSMIT
jgi:hypothetical protein